MITRWECHRHLWFLLMLFLVFAMVWCLSTVLEKHHVLSVLIAGGFFVAGVLGASVLPNVFRIWTACKYVMFFIAGFKMRQLGTALLRKIPWFVWLAAHIGMFALTQFLSGYRGGLMKLVNMGMNTALNLLGAVMAFVVLQWLAAKVPYQKSGLFRLLSKMSMPIYLFHQQIVYVFILLLNGVVHPYVHAGVNFIGAMVLSALISAIALRFEPTRILIGEKG